jgi:hypothetical protein
LFPAPGAPARAGRSIRFENVTGGSGLAFVLQQHATPDKHMVETMAGGLAVFDYDGDGRPDIFFTNGAALPSLNKQTPADWNRLYHNDGNFHFSDVTERAGVQGIGYATGAASGDFDNDGHEDLFVAGVQRNQLLRNRGDGTFEDVTAKAGIANYTWSVAAGWFDFDNDGWLDLFIVNYVDWTPETNKYCGDRARDLRVYCHPKHYRGLANALYRNRHDGTFEDVTAKSGIGAQVGKGMSVAFADYDGDGFTDIFVTNDAVPDFLFHNRGNGTFEEVGLLAGVAVPAHGRPVSSMGTDFRDVDNDGWPDIVLTALNGETFPFFKNDGGKFFHDATYPSGLGAASVRMAGWGAAFVDLDNDGFKDLVTANSHANDRIEEFESSSYRQTNGLFRNNAGHFTDVAALAGPDFAVARANRGVGCRRFRRRRPARPRLHGARRRRATAAQRQRRRPPLDHAATGRQGEQPRRHPRPREDRLTGRSDDNGRGLRVVEQLRRALWTGRREDDRQDRDRVAEREEAGAREGAGRSDPDSDRAVIPVEQGFSPVHQLQRVCPASLKHRSKDLCHWCGHLPLTS